MGERIREALLRALRVPPQPTVPSGSTSVRVFRAAPSYYRYRFALWALQQLGALAALIAGLVFLELILRTDPPGWLRGMLRFGEAMAWLGFIAQLPFTWAVMRLDYDMRWYILSDRSLRIREGIVSVREKTMTFANIQQIAIRQNPLQRILGISDVEVRTAGGGVSGSGKGPESGEIGESMHQAFFRGVANAEEIRGVIQERVRLHRDSGLGDPDELSDPDSTSGAALAAACELRDEMRLLRTTVTAARSTDQGSLPARL